MTAMSETKKAALSGKYAAYPEYKDSGVEWLNEIPTHWVEGKIKYVTTNLDYRRIPLSAEERGKRKGSFPYYGASGIIDSVDNFLFDEQTILIGEDGANLLSRSTPLAFIASGKYWVNNHAHILEPLDKIYTYWVNAFNNIDITPVVSGSAQPKLTAEALGNLSIVYPASENERKQIAVFLDHETAKIDTLIEKQQQLIELLKEKRQAVISHAVTKGLNPDAPMKNSGVEWLGEVPEHWSVKKIKHFGRVIGGFAFKSGDFIKQGYPVVKITNVSHLTMSFNELAYLPETFAHDNSEYIAPPNSLVFAMTRPIIAGGIKVAKMPKLEKMPLINQRVGFLKIEDENLTDYILFSSLSNSFIAQFKNNMTITNQPNISSEGIESVSFPFPPKDELKEITAYLTNNENKFDSLIKKSKEQVHLLTERRTALISAAVTGKIDVRNWVASATSSDTNEIQQQEATA
ncbi:hypothetical protein C0W35_09745 [Photobacterium kishitanii]|uniref:restriction endonuclease subunit S n=1 Tax=Photobacterium kishitanii TaxID=318456 RepID=UPI000D160828|nr:restriction endonuclease subunit S [Photobacterium kishitanii]PSU93976.1 hypothetical protein C0W35_09745 [Photobacterium kishitanii]